ncbi:hypothetical protein EYF80_048094 [Liparis tanakae]|uniref:Uncharacterized protein n=1 Tax=Liparis tanakae TaxID=230148 RepID=A0A4Z2FL36_9TELE|nr:hypothetical protein EYF80_048094 [Liparis tanakae]
MAVTLANLSSSVSQLMNDSHRRSERKSVPAASTACSKALMAAVEVAVAQLGRAEQWQSESVPQPSPQIPALRNPSPRSETDVAREHPGTHRSPQARCWRVGLE